MSSGATRRQRRTARRRTGEREITRRATTLVKRILDLAEAEPGYSPAAIASSVGLPEETVRSVLELREGAAE